MTLLTWNMYPVTNSENGNIAFPIPVRTDMEVVLCLEIEKENKSENKHRQLE